MDGNVVLELTEVYKKDQARLALSTFLHIIHTASDAGQTILPLVPGTLPGQPIQGGNAAQKGEDAGGQLNTGLGNTGKAQLSLCSRAILISRNHHFWSSIYHDQGLFGSRKSFRPRN